MSLFVVLISFLSLVFGTDEAEIVFAGDAMMHQRQIDAARRRDGSYDFSEYFSAIGDYIKDADYAVVNLETPVSGAPYSGYPKFNAPAAYIDALADAGFDLMLTANNHTLDRGDKGLCNTIDSIASRRLQSIGTYKNQEERRKMLPFIKSINGIKIAFLNYTYGTNGIFPGKDVAIDYIDRDLIKEDVADARAAGAEFIFVCIHWGNEYEMLPHSSQRELAEYIKGLDVDAVIGSHPHVIQPFELKDDKLVVYSLGNFISDMRTKDTRGGAMVKVTVKRDSNGKVGIDDVSYRLVFTEPFDGRRNYRLQWVDASPDPRAKLFAKSARDIFKKHNIYVREELPFK